MKRLKRLSEFLNTHGNLLYFLDSVSFILGCLVLLLILIMGLLGSFIFS